MRSWLSLNSRVRFFLIYFSASHTVNVNWTYYISFITLTLSPYLEFMTPFLPPNMVHLWRYGYIFLIMHLCIYLFIQQSSLEYKLHHSCLSRASGVNRTLSFLWRKVSQRFKNFPEKYNVERVLYSVEMLQLSKSVKIFSQSHFW